MHFKHDGLTFRMCTVANKVRVCPGNIQNVVVGSGSQANHKFKFMCKLCYFFIQNIELCIFSLLCLKRYNWFIIKGNLCCSIDTGFSIVYSERGQFNTNLDIPSREISIVHSPRSTILTPV